MTLPAKFKISNVTIVDNTAKVESDTRSLGYLSRNITGQRFEFRIQSIELQQQVLKEVMAQISGIRRSNSVLNLILPIFSESDATTKQTAQTRDIGNFTITLANVDDIKIGDFFNFAGHTKAYQVVNKVGLQLEFTPNLVRPVTNGEFVTFNGCSFACKIKGRPQEYSVNGDNNSARVELNIVEVR